MAANTAFAQTASVQEEIVVTGTRIVRDGYQAPTPITVFGAEEINRIAAVNFADVAAKIPTLSGSMSSHTNTMNVTDGTGGTNTLALRGMGSNRTLVLMDGVRVAGSGQSGSVDINSFPDGLISRMDIVTGGATAVYGSGAVAGVVSVILDKTFTGIKGSVTGGITTYGDDPQYAVALTGGTPFANGRGHFLISASTHWTKGIPDAADARDWMRVNWSRMTNPAYTATNGQPFYLILPNIGPSGFAAGGIITGGPLKGITFEAGGRPRQFNYGPINDGLYMQGGEYLNAAGGIDTNWGPDASLDAGLSRQNFFTRASYDVSDNVQVYFQFADSFTTTDINSRYNRATLTIRADNAFIPAETAARMTALGVTTFPFAFYSPDLGKIGSTGRRHFNQYLGGFEGSFDIGEASWSWDLFASRSNSRWSMLARNVYNRTKFAAATDAVRGANGVVACRVNTDTNAANDAPGCVPYNIMGIGVASQAAFDYVMSDRAAAVQYQILDQVSASVSGEPFSIWAGPVSLAMGVEYFVNEARGFSSPVAEAALFSTANFVSTNGKYNTKEAFAETVIPLAVNEDWAQSLEVNGGIRIADFSTSGVVWAWKMGLSYSPVADLRFRATRSRDTRSPLMGELFASGASAGTTINDPTLNRISYVIDIATTGNLGLSPEKANTLGVGVVYQSSLIPGFSAAIDYYKIDVFASIASQGTQATIDRCFEGQQSFCNNILRGADGRIQRVFNRPANAGSALSEGIDFEASYRVPLSSIVDSWNGDLTIRGLATRITEQTSTAPDGTVTINSLAPWNYTMSVVYDIDNFTASWTGRGAGNKNMNANWIQCTSGCPAIAPPVYTANDLVINSKFYQDVSFTYRLEPADGFSADIFFAVENIANLDPDPKANVVGGAISDVGNPLGRIFKGGVRFRM